MVPNGVDVFQKLNALVPRFINDHPLALRLLATLVGITVVPNVIMDLDFAGVWILMVLSSLGPEHVATNQIVALATGNKYDEKYLMSNEVMEKSLSSLKLTYNSPLSPYTDCPPSSKPAMANRLLDWFSVVMVDSKHRRPRPKPKVVIQGGFQLGCAEGEPMTRGI